MSAPPPPPPPPPPGPSNIPRPNNKDLLASICHGTTLKKLPDSLKNDRSAVVVGKSKSANAGSNNMGSLVPPTGAMSLSEAILARKNMTSGSSNVRKPGAPPPNAVQSSAVPPPPSQNKKPFSDTKQAHNPTFSQPPALNTKPVQEMKSLPLSFPPPLPQGGSIPPPPPPTALNHSGPFPPPPFLSTNNNIFPQPNQVININAPPPPPPKEIKPRFRPPVPICGKPMANDENNNRGMGLNQGRGPIPPPPPPLPPQNDVGPPKFGPPPPPPPMPIGKMQIPIHQINSHEKPVIPIRIDSNCNFDSRFTFVDPKYFPEPNSITKMRHS